jgi:hypothetical protein
VEWVPLILEDFQDAALWEGMLHGTEQRLQAETDPRVRAGLEHSISFFRYVVVEIDFLEDRIRRIVEIGGSLEEALQIPLPAPFDGWLVGGMYRFAANVQSLFKRCGGEVPEPE